MLVGDINLHPHKRTFNDKVNMTELELYKYIQENGIEWHRYENDGKEDVLIFPYIFQLEEFANMIKNATDEEGVECRIKGNYVAVWMLDICEYFGIEMDNVFKGDNYDD